MNLILESRQKAAYGTRGPGYDRRMMVVIPDFWPSALCCMVDKVRAQPVTSPRLWMLTRLLRVRPVGLILLSFFSSPTCGFLHFSLNKGSAVVLAGSASLRLLSGSCGPHRLVVGAHMSTGHDSGLADIGKAPGGKDAPSGTGHEQTDSDVDAEVPGKDGEKPRWLQDLSRSLARNSRDAHSRFIQLATIKWADDGTPRPACRWVVFRGFLPGSEVLKFITDSRSEKVPQLMKNDFGEISWYFVKTREQFRLSGRLRVVTTAEQDALLQGARKQQWSSISGNARLQFVWPDPGQPQPDDQDPSVFQPPAPDPKNPPDTFCLVLFYPDKVDHLQLKASPQRRVVHTLQEPDGADVCRPANELQGYHVWESVNVNP